MPQEQDLREFVHETLSQIDEGLVNYSPSGPIKFDLAVVKTVDTGGKLSIKVVEAGRSTVHEETSRVSFEVMRTAQHPAHQHRVMHSFKPNRS